MKTVILAGGLGTRLAEQTDVIPKPLVEIGGRPIIWHIIKYYAHHGFSEFCIALGYKGEVIKRYFIDYHLLTSTLSVNVKTGEVNPHASSSEDWVIHLVDTGQDTLTAGRVKRMEPWIDGETFMVTYGDGVSDVDIRKLIAFHESQGKLATVTAVRPPARFGGLVFDGELVKQFTEKPQIGEGWINGGFLVLEPGVFEYIEGDGDSLEVDLLERLASQGQLAAYRHDGFWQCMDTLRDVRLLESLWQSDKPPWKIWD